MDDPLSGVDCQKGESMEYLDDDENVKAMRETARAIGLTELLVRAARTTDREPAAGLLADALMLLGVNEQNPIGLDSETTESDMERES